MVENKNSEYKIDELSKRCSLVGINGESKFICVLWRFLNVYVMHKFQLMKDKEDLNGQYKKSKLALTKLESLCRELQKHNRLMKVRIVVNRFICS